MPCCRPILIDNLNRTFLPKPRHVFDEAFNRHTVIFEPSYHVTDPTKDISLKIAVPCGTCPECVRRKQMYIVQRTHGEVIAGNDLYFFTLTYKNSMLPRIDIGDKTYYYSDYSDVYNMFNRIRNSGAFGRDFKYMVASEFGGKRYRPHFHGIISAPPDHPNETRAEKISRGLRWHDIVLSEWKRNVAPLIWSEKKQKYIVDTFHPDWKPLCTFIVAPNGHRTFDFHWVDPMLSENGEDDVAFYVTKYCLKFDERFDKLRSYFKLNFPREEYLYYWRLVTPRIWFSKFYGSPKDPLVIDHVTKGVKMAIRDRNIYPYFINPNSGQTFPLCTYYRQRILDKLLNDRLFYSQFPHLKDIEFPTYEDFCRAHELHHRRMSIISEHDVTDFFPEDLDL